MISRKLKLLGLMIYLVSGVAYGSQYTSIVIEEGQRYSPSAGALKYSSNGRNCRFLSFNLRNGSAVFVDGTRKKIVRRCKNVSVPAIIAGAVGDESRLVIRSNSRKRIASIRVTAMQRSAMTDITRIWPQNSYRVTRTYLLLNERKLPKELENVGQVVQMGSSGDVVSNRSMVCWRRAWGPGEAHWKMNEPRWEGYGYIKEADDNRLFRPAGNATVKRDVDAFCRDSWQGWRAHSAIKVPNSCTATINANHTRSYCCNAAMKAAGHVPKWVYTGAGAKPWWAVEKIAAWNSCRQ